MTTTLDIAAAVSAIIWPAVVLVILLVYRRSIPALVESLASRISKLEVAGVSIELAVAKPFIADWSAAATPLDLRSKATAVQVNDSTARTFVSQLTDDGTGDYAEVNLGTGDEWLTSRLFIMAIVFARMKGIKAFVFLETSGTTRKRYVGWAEPQVVRWALSKRYAWLEQAYAEAYSTVTSQQRAFVVSNQGRLGYQHSPHDPGASIELLREFLQRIQMVFPAPLLPPVPPDPQEWVLLDPQTNTFEHARWVNGAAIEDLLGGDLNSTTVPLADLRSKSTLDQLRGAVSGSGRFVAATSDDQRFQSLVDRSVVLEQVAQRVSAEDSK